MGVAQGRELQREAFDIAFQMSDSDARRRMLFVAESYALSAPRSLEKRLEVAEAKKAHVGVG
jgi:sulfur relay (sulfurtransferase) DsrF/TusC family protein